MKAETCKKCNIDVFCIEDGELYCIEHHKQNKMIIGVYNPKEKIKECIYCSEEKCICNKTHRIKITINEGELNALEDLGVVDLKTIFLSGRDIEIGEWQKRCFNLWKKLVKKVDRK